MALGGLRKAFRMLVNSFTKVAIPADRSEVQEEGIHWDSGAVIFAPVFASLSMPRATA